MGMGKFAKVGARNSKLTTWEFIYDPPRQSGPLGPPGNTANGHWRPENCEWQLGNEDLARVEEHDKQKYIEGAFIDEKKINYIVIWNEWRH